MEFFKDTDCYYAMMIKSKARKEVWRIQKIMATKKDVDTNSDFFNMFCRSAFCKHCTSVPLEKAKGMWDTGGFKELGMKAIRKRRTDVVVAVKKDVIRK
jgi:hypothetical protein